MSIHSSRYSHTNTIPLDNQQQQQPANTDIDQILLDSSINNMKDQLSPHLSDTVAVQQPSSVMSRGIHISSMSNTDCSEFETKQIKQAAVSSRVPLEEIVQNIQTRRVNLIHSDSSSLKIINSFDQKININAQSIQAAAEATANGITSLKASNLSFANAYLLGNRRLVQNNSSVNSDAPQTTHLAKKTVRESIKYNESTFTPVPEEVELTTDFAGGQSREPEGQTHRISARNASQDVHAQEDVPSIQERMPLQEIPSNCNFDSNGNYMNNQLIKPKRDSNTNNQPTCKKPCEEQIPSPIKIPRAYPRRASILNEMENLQPSYDQSFYNQQLLYHQQQLQQQEKNHEIALQVREVSTLKRISAALMEIQVGLDAEEGLQSIPDQLEKLVEDMRQNHQFPRQKREQQHEQQQYQIQQEEEEQSAIIDKPFSQLSQNLRDNSATPISQIQHQQQAQVLPRRTQLIRSSYDQQSSLSNHRNQVDSHGNRSNSPLKQRHLTEEYQRDSQRYQSKGVGAVNRQKAIVVQSTASQEAGDVEPIRMHGGSLNQAMEQSISKQKRFEQHIQQQRRIQAVLVFEHSQQEHVIQQQVNESNRFPPSTNKSMQQSSIINEKKKIQKESQQTQQPSSHCDVGEETNRSNSCNVSSRATNKSTKQSGQQSNRSNSIRNNNKLPTPVPVELSNDGQAHPSSYSSKSSIKQNKLQVVNNHNTNETNSNPSGRTSKPKPRKEKFIQRSKRAISTVTSDSEIDNRSTLTKRIGGNGSLLNSQLAQAPMKEQQLEQTQPTGHRSDIVDQPSKSNRAAILDIVQEQPKDTEPTQEDLVESVSKDECTQTQQQQEIEQSARILATPPAKKVINVTELLSQHTNFNQQPSAFKNTSKQTQTTPIPAISEELLEKAMIPLQMPSLLSGVKNALVEPTPGVSEVKQKELIQQHTPTPIKTIIPQSQQKSAAIVSAPVLAALPIQVLPFEGQTYSQQSQQYQLQLQPPSQMLSELTFQQQQQPQACESMLRIPNRKNPSRIASQLQTLSRMQEAPASPQTTDNHTQQYLYQQQQLQQNPQWQEENTYSLNSGPSIRFDDGFVSPVQKQTISSKLKIIPKEVVQQLSQNPVKIGFNSGVPSLPRIPFPSEVRKSASISNSNVKKQPRSLRSISSSDCEVTTMNKHASLQKANNPRNLTYQQQQQQSHQFYYAQLQSQSSPKQQLIHLPHLHTQQDACTRKTTIDSSTSTTSQPSIANEIHNLHSNNIRIKPLNKQLPLNAIPQQQKYRSRSIRLQNTQQHNLSASIDQTQHHRDASTSDTHSQQSVFTHYKQPESLRYQQPNQQPRSPTGERSCSSTLSINSANDQTNKRSLSKQEIHQQSYTTDTNLLQEIKEDSSSAMKEVNHQNAEENEEDIQIDSQYPYQLNLGYQQTHVNDIFVALQTAETGQPRDQLFPVVLKNPFSSPLQQLPIDNLQLSKIEISPVITKYILHSNVSATRAPLSEVNVIHHADVQQNDFNSLPWEFKSSQASPQNTIILSGHVDDSTAAPCDFTFAKVFDEVSLIRIIKSICLSNCALKKNQSTNVHLFESVLCWDISVQETSLEAFEKQRNSLIQQKPVEDSLIARLLCDGLSELDRLHEMSIYANNISLSNLVFSDQSPMRLRFHNLHNEFTNPTMISTKNRISFDLQQLAINILAFKMSVDVNTAAKKPTDLLHQWRNEDDDQNNQKARYHLCDIISEMINRADMSDQFDENQAILARSYLDRLKRIEINSKTNGSQSQTSLMQQQPQLTLQDLSVMSAAYATINNASNCLQLNQKILETLKLIHGRTSNTYLSQLVDAGLTSLMLSQSSADYWQSIVSETLQESPQSVLRTIAVTVVPAVALKFILLAAFEMIKQNRLPEAVLFFQAATQVPGIQVADVLQINTNIGIILYGLEQSTSAVEHLRNAAKAASVLALNKTSIELATPFLLIGLITEDVSSLEKALEIKVKSGEKQSKVLNIIFKMGFIQLRKRQFQAGVDTFKAYLMQAQNGASFAWSQRGGRAKKVQQSQLQNDDAINKMQLFQAKLNLNFCMIGCELIGSPHIPVIVKELTSLCLGELLDMQGRSKFAALVEIAAVLIDLRVPQHLLEPIYQHCKAIAVLIGDNSLLEQIPQKCQ